MHAQTFPNGSSKVMPASSVEENTEVQISPIEIVQIVDAESGHFQVAF